MRSSDDAGERGGTRTFNAFIAPDESYLIATVDGRADLTPPGPRYMIFFRGPDDSWSEGVDLGARAPLRNGNAGSPYVSPDGKYFFFGSSQTSETSATAHQPLTFRALREANDQPRNGNMDIYWVDASFLAALRPVRATKQ